MTRAIPTLLLLALLGGATVQGQTPNTSGKPVTMTRLAKGTFSVKVAPITPADSVDTGGFARFALDKTFQGDLAGTSLGQMLATGDGSSGSGGYVALEKVTGTLSGRTGSFVLMHNGTMTPASMDLRIGVVPASGTGELAGISGTFKIIIEGKQHFWELEYTLPD